MRVRIGAALAALALVLIIGGWPLRAAAESSDKDKAGPKGPHVTQATGKFMNEAVEQLRANHPNEARDALGKLNLEKLSPYELSRVEQLYAAIDQSEQKYPSARDHLKKALASEGLNDQEASTARFQIARLFMAEEKWREGVDALKTWFAAEPNPNSAAYYLLAVAYYQLNDMQSALEPAQKAIDLSGGKPNESWLQLLLSLRIARNEYKLAVPLLKQLIEAAPTKKNYWIQLSSVHASTGDYKEGTPPLQLAYFAGLLTQDQELRRLAQLLVQIGIPYRAAQILAKGIEQKQIAGDTKAYELLGNCFIASREYDKAIPPLERAAALSDNGDLFVRVAEVHLQREKWAEAAAALHRALEKGKLKNPGSAHLLLGMCMYNQKKPGEARVWFQRAREQSSSRAQADGWLKQIDADANALK